MSHLSQVYTRGMLQTLQNDRNYRLEQFIVVTAVNMRMLSRLLACKATDRGSVSTIVLNVTNSKKLQRLASDGNT